MTASLRPCVAAFLWFFAAASALHAQVNPALIGPLTAGDLKIQGVGDPAAGTTFFVCIAATAPNPPLDCSTSTPNLAATALVAPITPAGATQLFTATLTSALTAGSFVYLEQQIAGSTTPTFSQVLPVAGLGTENEREQTEFVGGTLLSANGANYSQASLFLALNYDRTLWRPGWYRGKDTACVRRLLAGVPSQFPVKPVTPADQALPLVLCPRTRHPGLNTFFQTRLTTIPVNASTTTTTPPASGTATPETSVSSFLAAQKSAQFSGGIYAPILFGKVPSNMEKNATFYIAPIARFGFSTPTASPSGSSSTPTAGGTTTTTTTTSLGTASPNTGQLYNYGLVGMRVATAKLNPGSLYTVHYFDVGVGKYSNLQSLVCKAGPTACQSMNTATPPVSYFDISKENRVTLLRLEFEGYLEIISAKNSSLILGISANTGPGFLDHRANLDINNRAAEDIEFLIGYKFDVSQLLGGISILGKNP